MAGVALLAVAAAAQTGSPFVSFESQLPGLRQRPARQAWEQLQLPLPHWLNDPEYHYWRGVFALGAGEVVDARDSFERTLMLEPNHAGAFYDYALTLCRMGERQSCQSLLAEARRQFGPPPAMAHAPRHVVLGEVRAGMGFSTNLNRAPLRDTLAVQLDGVQVDLQLADELRPRRGAYLDTGIDARYLQLDTGLRLGASAYHRRSAHGLSAVTLVAGEARLPVADRQQTGLQAYSLHEGGGRGLASVGAIWEWQPNGVWKRFAVTGERRRLSESGAGYGALRLDAQYQPYPQWSLGAFAETETKSDLRAGQGSRRLGLVLQREAFHTPAGSLEAAVRLNFARDLAAYSPLFGDTRRNLRQGELNLRLTTPLNEGVFARAGSPNLRTELRAFGQRSSIALFDIREWQLQVSLVWQLQN